MEGNLIFEENQGIRYEVGKAGRLPVPSYQALSYIPSNNFHKYPQIPVQGILLIQIYLGKKNINFLRHH